MTAPPPTAALTPEELAREIALPDALTFKDKDGLRTAIAAAIRQHSEAQRAEIERLTAALKKIDAVRDSIVAFQKVNFSEHVYPLVAALDEAGFEGMGYPAAVKYYGSMMDRTNAAEAALSASQERERRMQEALTKPGKLVYLDGRTEDAAHVVPFPMQTAEIDTDRDLTESAEAIYDEAAKLGYGDGCAVWCEFSHFPGQYGDYGMCEIAPGYEFVGINPLLTEMFGGHPPKDDAASKETADER